MNDPQGNNKNPEEHTIPTGNEPYALSYGFPFAPNTPQPHKELFAYALTRGKYGKHLQNKLLESQGYCLGDFKFLSPVEHMLNFVRFAWPSEVVIDSNGCRNRPMLRVLDALCNYDDVGIAGAAGLSKSFGCAVFINTDWFAAPSVTSTFLASTTFEALENRAWGHVSNLYKTSLFKVGTYLEYKRMIVSERVDLEG